MGMLPPRVLLLQARQDDDPMAEHELACFVESTGLPRDHVLPHNLTGGPPTRAKLDEYDALMVGGSGDFYVSRRNVPEFEPLMDFLGGVVARGFPTFASCFGYQLLVAVLGGEIIYDPDNTEVGTYEITLTDAGVDDPLLGALPRRALAQMGHKDRARRQPPGIANLAESALSENQAFRVPDQPIWATQFHPELRGETNRERYMHYLSSYAEVLDERTLEEARSRFRESPEVSDLLPRFLSLVFDWTPSGRARKLGRASDHDGYGTERSPM